MREGAEVDILSLPCRFGGMGNNSLEPMQTQNRPANLQPGCGILLALGNDRGLRPERLTFWIGPSQRTTMAPDGPEAIGSLCAAPDRSEA